MAEEKKTETKPELFANWTTPVAIPFGEPDILRDDTTPSIIEQAKANGWNAAYYNFGKAEHDGTDRFNPALIQREDGYWLLVRQSEPHPQGFSFGQNHIVAFMLDKEGKTPKMGVKLKWPVNDPQQHFEDPRGFYYPRLNQTLIGVCTFLWHPDRSWTGAHQAFGAFDENWECKNMTYPQIGGNPGRMEKIPDPQNYQKNWIWWMHDDRLHLLYKANPWTVLRFGNRWTEHEDFKLQGVTWPYGEIRGGTTPVLIGDLYFTFHHSSLPWRGRYRRYYAGAIGFEPFPPYKPKIITREPLLIGSQQDHWEQRKPLVAFPCGALFINGKWLVSLGVNDLKSAWLELSHESLLERMVPVEETGTEIFQMDGSRGILPVPVLAEPKPAERKGEQQDGEARESTDPPPDRGHTDSRGGQKTLSGDARADKREAEAHAMNAGTASPAQAFLDKPTLIAENMKKVWESGVRDDYVKTKAEIAKRNRQAGAARARAARMAKRIAIKNCEIPAIPKKRRRRKLRKRPSAHARLLAAQEFEATKKIANTEVTE